MRVEDFIWQAMYNNEDQVIYGIRDGGLQRIADLRGWGKIQQLFENEKDAVDFQDELGEWIADAINQKLRNQQVKF